MDDLNAFKNFLGSVAAAYTDEQLEQLRRDFDIAADLLLDLDEDDHRSKHAVARPAVGIDKSRTVATIKSEDRSRRSDISNATQSP